MVRLHCSLVEPLWLLSQAQAKMCIIDSLVNSTLKQNKISFCCPDWHHTLGNPPVLASQVLGSQDLSHHTQLPGCFLTQSNWQCQSSHWPSRQWPLNRENNQGWLLVLLEENWRLQELFGPGLFTQEPQICLSGHTWVIPGGLWSDQAQDLKHTAHT